MGGKAIGEVPVHVVRVLYRYLSAIDFLNKRRCGPFVTCHAPCLLSQLKPILSDVFEISFEANQTLRPSGFEVSQNEP